MSLTKSKWILAVLVVQAVLVAVPQAAYAVPGMRLWTPYTDTQKRRDPNGFFASVEAVYWTVSPQPTAQFGYSNHDGNRRVTEADTVLDPRADQSGATKVYLPVGSIINSDASKVYTETSGAMGQRLVMNGNNAFYQNNSLNTGLFDNPFVAGTRVEFGNIRDHHGWYFSGYGLPSAQSSFKGQGASMVIFDNENVTAYKVGDEDNISYGTVFRPDPTDPSNVGKYEFVPRSAEGMISPLVIDPITGQTLYNEPIPKVGYLWAWFPSTWSSWEEGRLAPAPIQFREVEFSSKVDHFSTELMYMYRFHPTRWGGLELTAGIRYWEMKDGLGFRGIGVEELDDMEDVGNNNSSSGSGSSSSNNNSNDTGSDVKGGLKNDYGGQTILADTTLNSTGLNQIIGPQVGIRFNRKTGRWTGMFECKFFAGLNNQDRKVDGQIGTYLVDTNNITTLLSSTSGSGSSSSSSSSRSSNSQDSSLLNRGIFPHIPIGFTQNNSVIGDRMTYRTFSPGVELRLNANWQLTKAVGLQVGFTSMYVGNVVRGGQICDYTIHEDGHIFKTRRGSSVNSDVFTYGVTFGLVANRF